MSMELMVKAMKTKVGNPLRKLVLLKLADNASDQGECWPSYQYIADQCEISRRAVVGHINALIETGVLSKTLRKGEKGNSSNVYLLNFHLLKPVYNDKGSLIGYLLPGESVALGGADAALGGADAALGGGAASAPRTSHSLEPVNESVNEPKDHLSDSAESNETAPVVVDQKFNAKAKRELLAHSFELFWNAYQRKDNRKASEAKWLKIPLPNDREQAVAKIQLIIDQAQRWGDLYAAAPADQKQFQPMPTTWINNERWNDEQLPTIRQQAKPGGAIDWNDVFDPEGF
ncbi:helix-turn-helix domain-containing protein [Marinomonas ostreistagni]|uniref:Helix-turn-helix domain-containing protein n=1 Tax=Marinomonas ostreistagni TaxID=359209 RepID=A0ABS0ZAT7_9GAMM|nr:helix-turn-helix domain-containing protein [Marinomonas ostreistagni]MBJ7550769.1 helix-turn-helix domain-containing protein [Marinomonas ostreistagni]